MSVVHISHSSSFTRREFTPHAAAGSVFTIIFLFSFSFCICVDMEKSADTLPIGGQSDYFFFVYVAICLAYQCNMPKFNLGGSGTWERTHGSSSSYPRLLSLYMSVIHVTLLYLSHILFLFLPHTHRRSSVVCEFPPSPTLLENQPIR